jgi:spermidine/putrescine transport system permease protein
VSKILSDPSIRSNIEENTAVSMGGTILHQLGRLTLVITPIAGYFFLWAPILLLVLFSFNDSRAVNTWHGFTTRWYENIFNGVVGSEARFSTALMLSALQNTLLVSVTATIISTIIGTMVALSLARSRFIGKKLLDSVLLLPVVIPEITQGVSLAIFFKVVFDFFNNTVGIDLRPGFGTIIIAHVAFNISYVAIVVRARLAYMDPRLEEAAQDLGADHLRTFWYVTLPLIIPGIIAGALLAFTLSLDDFVVTFFTSGVGTTTLPIFVYGLLKVSVTPEVNALSTLMLVASTVLVGISLIIQNRFSERSVVRRV